MRCRLPRIVTLFLLASGAASAQPSARVYAEVLGNGGAGSANVEVVATRTLAVRAGVGYMPAWPETTANALTAPLMAVWLPSGESGFEAGVGATIRYRTGTDGFAPGFTDTFATATLGYRWVTRGGTLFRVGLTPLYGWPEGNRQVSGVVPLVGVSVGRAR